MNVNIPFIKNKFANTIEYLQTSNLSSYILSEDEQQYIKNIATDSSTTISNLLLAASVKAGSSLYTQPELNKIYVRYGSSYKENDKKDFKDFMNTKLVGNNVIGFLEMGDV